MENINTVLTKRGDNIFYKKDGNEYQLNAWREFGIESQFGRNNTIDDVRLEGVIELDTKKNKRKFKPKKLIIKDKEYVRIQASQTQAKPLKASSEKKETTMAATAPYNFVPLNTTVIYTDNPTNDFSQFSGKSGYIDLRLENKTPFFIRGNGSDFFKIDGQAVVPGSSFRGLIRNMVEIMSYAKMQMYNQQHLYMRFIAAGSSKFKTNYYQKMGLAEEESNKPVKHKAQAGFLKYDKEKKQYEIWESDEVKTFEEENFRPFDYIRKGDFCEVYSGNMNGKKMHYAFKFPKPDAPKIAVPFETIKSYESDLTRKIKVNLLNLAKEKDAGIPVFYVLEGDWVVSFGHTKNYRIPYTKSIADAVTQEIKEDLDLAESIFGKIDEKDPKKNLAGKVYFEDLRAIETHELPQKTPQVLGSPRPTSFQLYLEQANGVKTTLAEQSHWDSPQAQIRGHKQYWHRQLGSELAAPGSTNSWAVDTHHAQFSKNVSPEPIKALDKAVFEGRIRFENLSDVELGALLAALCLPENCCHKLGMGKPLGLGSVRVQNVQLQMKNTQNRYKNLFNDLGEFETGLEAGNVENYIVAFQNYVKKELSATDTDYWALPRIKELYTMLNFEQKPAPTATRYQTSNEFRNRHVLPKPTEIL